MLIGCTATDNLVIMEYFIVCRVYSLNLISSLLLSIYFKKKHKYNKCIQMILATYRERSFQSLLCLACKKPRTILIKVKTQLNQKKKLELNHCLTILSVIDIRLFS